ncbi:regulatory protein MarR [Emticicia oligotrophica DSM 17448]|uniref:Regulatory protein MarR n=1 Tax=Emticicia oligotrophica (strain DSM 17448 / CIP 109782 / MTCC 6937 / GPTSA100-15) TaxID=929562 RepID=A0ABN4AIJ4_EMTOG|nr:winged helix DNA-binding protein [Emticicia oligotrophica]AFK01946.1 regulatory protein MarR [Emticicia oligotrophica DSM 17448]
MSKKIVELVNLWSKYEDENPEMSITDFCVRYLAENNDTRYVTDTLKLPINAQLASLMGRLVKFSNHYAKKALDHFPLNNLEDWVYLISLMDLRTPKKSELIYEMLSEFPSGIDIIKRLIAADLVEEFPDENDKRSKRVRITEKGLQVLSESMSYMDKVGVMAFDTLSASEKEMVVNILKRLDNFHNERFKEVRVSEFNEAFEILTK